ncbi:MAG: Fis family transcriptional regulator [Thermoproteus sp.]
MIVLNLTIPPLLILLLAPAQLSNISMPAPNASAIAAFTINGTPLPVVAYGGRIYVIQDGAPAYVEYIPAYINSSGVYELALSLDQPAVVVMPPGIMPQNVPQYRLIAMNNTGTYIQVGPGDVDISYYAARLSLAPATTSAAPPSTSTQTAPSAAQTAPTAPPSVSTQTAFTTTIAAAIAAVIVVIIAVVLIARRK